MQFTPLTPARLVDELASWIRRRADQAAAVVGSGRAGGLVIGIDGPAEIGTCTLADQVAQALQASGTPVIRACTNWWWRPSALRLELGRTDVDMLMTGWVDGSALRRELLDPVVTGALPYITRLRNPDDDRSVRQHPEIAPPGSILLLDGPFLLAADIPLDALVGLNVKVNSLRRALPEHKAWWIDGFARYQTDYRPTELADVLVSYDHADAPAAAGLTGDRAP